MSCSSTNLYVWRTCCLSAGGKTLFFSCKFSHGALTLLPGFKALALQILFPNYLSFPISLKKSDPIFHLPASPILTGVITILIVAWTRTLRLILLLIKKLLEPPGPSLSFLSHTANTHQELMCLRNGF